jgi:CubicO group peptidase (beta-lactamase class C family)
MRWSGVALLAFLLLAACADSGEDPADPGDPKDPSIERFLTDTLPEGASGTLIAARDGEIVHCDGFGMADREARVAATCDTVYDIQSITKQFTAAAILKLEMMGGLRTQNRISEYLGPVPPDKREITVHHLLTHTAGLIDALGDDYARLSRAELIAGALDSELRSPPGAEYHYSNLGYGLLAAIIEIVSGSGYEEFLDEQLFGPAGMTETGYIRPGWEPEQVAVDYDARGRPHGRPFEHPWAQDGPYWNLRGNGGLLTSAPDMFRWHLALEGEAVLDQGAIEKLFRPHARADEGRGSYYGYGWVIQRDADHGRVAWHDGGNDWNFGMFARLLDEGVMVFWVTNRYRNEDEGWNLYRLEPKLTSGVVDRALDVWHP